MKKHNSQRVLADIEQHIISNCVDDALGLLDGCSVKNEKDRDAIFKLAYLADQEARYPIAKLGYKKILEYDPGDLAASNNLGTLYIRNEEMGKARKVLEGAIAAKPDAWEPKANLCAYYINLERSRDAFPILQKLIQEQPDNAQIHYMLASALHKQEMLESALKYYQKAIELDPRHWDAYINLAKLVYGAGKNEIAKSLFLHVVKECPEKADAWIALGLMALEADDLEVAGKSFSMAKKVSKDARHSLRAMASLFEIEGSLDKAMEAYDLLSDSGAQNNPLSIMAKSRFKKGDLSNSEVEALLEAIAEGELSSKQLAGAHFSIAQWHEKKKHYEEEIFHLRKANALVKSYQPYNGNELSKSFTQKIEFFTKDFFDLEPECSNSHTPIFIVGMPRSGSTLVEQIISSHSQVGDLGEVDFLATSCNYLLTNDPFGYDVDGNRVHKPLSYYQEISDRYIQNVFASKKVNMDKPFTDKNLFNYQRIHLIRKSFPNAKVIHIHRHPVDNCLGIFRRMFREGLIRFSYDLEDLAQSYIDYNRLMNHWNTIIPGFIYDLSYEDLVKDFDAQVRSLIDFCGLEWEDSCLEFYKNERSVKTASNLQVRQPIYQNAVEKWKNFAPYLTDLQKKLADAGVKL